MTEVQAMEWLSYVTPVEIYDERFIEISSGLEDRVLYDLRTCHIGYEGMVFSVNEIPLDIRVHSLHEWKCELSIEMMTQMHETVPFWLEPILGLFHE